MYDKDIYAMDRWPLTGFSWFDHSVQRQKSLITWVSVSVAHKYLHTQADSSHRQAVFWMQIRVDKKCPTQEDNRQPCGEDRQKTQHLHVKQHQRNENTIQLYET